MDIFAFLDGISPWWWVALGLALAVAELLTLTYYLLWLALAALSVAVALWIAPGLAGSAQILLFAVSGIAYTLAGWAWLRRRQPGEGRAGLNRRAAALIGREAVAVGRFRAGVGQVEIDGIRWRARLAPRSPAPKAGETVRVVDADGATLVVSGSSEG